MTHLEENDFKEDIITSDSENGILQGGEKDLRTVKANPNYWYPIAWSYEIDRGKAHAVEFAGEPIVLVRPENGEIFALEDRCSHRQVPLSKGVVEGQAVRCCYHGWTFDTTGKCVDVPYLGKGKLPNGVCAYPCQEQNGVVFIFPGDKTKAATTPLPKLAETANPDYKTRKFNPRVNCHYTFMHENLIDMNHQFLHRNIMGRIKARFLGKQTGDNFIEVKYSFARVGNKQPLAEALIFGKHHQYEDGQQPIDEIVTIRTEYPYQTLRVTSKDGTDMISLWVCYLPQGKNQEKTKAFGLLSVKRPKTPFLIDAIWPVFGLFTYKIFLEDKDIVELEQKAWIDQGKKDWNVEVFPVVRDLRTVLRNNGV
ncbi:Rieske 2Fe-2S domain-containing protein [Entomobacter blattae]|uniref:Rieske [2Fe-2S] domain protein n=1 Tax=Entomobacter blattae TaxID=2762277 RepID=A0A7H1NUY5_9PROT|nr:Rieske 2Fe-2S domain-containing protein [Entomobacter blattae]QNT79595.1 Rieske [2Fe-2S] domain protein [Entomobacter blattae]